MSSEPYIIWITNLIDTFRIEIAQQQKFRFSIFWCHAIQLVHVVVVHAKNVIVFFEIGRFNLVGGIINYAPCQ